MRISDWSSDVCSSDLRLHRCRSGMFHHADAGAQLHRTLDHYPIANGQAIDDFDITAPSRTDADRHLLHRIVIAHPEHECLPTDLDQRKLDRKSTSLNSSHYCAPRMPSYA